MITAPTNQKVKNLSNLMRKGKARREQKLFVAEGIKMFLEADPARIQEVYLSRSFWDKLEKGDEKEIKKRLSACSVEILTDTLFQRVSDTQTPQGILCVIRQHFYQPEDLLKKENPLLLLLEDIQDPGNLGTMFRTAEGTGVDGVIMSRGTADIYNPKTIRSTMGSVYRVPFLYTEDLRSSMAWLQERGIQIFAAHLQGKKAYYEENFQSGCAFLIGNEGKGLKEETALAAESLVKLPMEGKVESLNAAIAASVLLYEAARQRWLGAANGVLNSHGNIIKKRGKR